MRESSFMEEFEKQLEKLDVFRESFSRHFGPGLEKKPLVEKGKASLNKFVKNGGRHEKAD